MPASDHHVVRSKRTLRLMAMSGAAVAVAVLLAISLTAGSSHATNAPQPGGCTFGASSVSATFVGGHVVVSGPETSGCAPRRVVSP
jgi:hypothetical protein